MADSHFTSLAKIGLLEGLLAKMQDGSDAPVLVVYTGTRNNLGASTALVVFTLDDPAGTIDEGDVALDLVTAGASSMVLASGVPQWALLFDGNSQAFVDFDASGADGTGAVKLSVSDGDPIFAGGLVSLTSARFQF
jgi:microcompartment protein CcmK/EutM